MSNGWICCAVKKVWKSFDLSIKLQDQEKYYNFRFIKAKTDMYKFFTFLGIIVLVLHKSVAFIVTIDAHNEECFFDKVEGGSKFGITFEVIEGGFLDVDIKISGPDQHIMHESEKESSGKYTFVAPSTGIYKVCFNNEKSSMTPKVVMFSIDVGESPHRPPGAPGEEEVGHTKLEDMIRELSGLLTSVKHEQEYMHVRDKIHRSVNESTNSRVVMWSTFEALVLVLMTIGQVYYLKRFFEVKRVV